MNYYRLKNGDYPPATAIRDPVLAITTPVIWENAPAEQVNKVSRSVNPGIAFGDSPAADARF